LFLVSCLLCQSALAGPLDIGPFDDLTSDIGRGFGDNQNRYAFSMRTFRDELFVGTWNVQFDYPALIAAIKDGSLDLSGGNILEQIGFLSTEGAQIWRYLGTKEWAKVYDFAETGNPSDLHNSGVRQMRRFGDHLYAGTVNAAAGASMLKTADGTTWAAVSGGPLNNPDNISIRTMVEHDGFLYVGFENNATGGELWRLDHADRWTDVASFPDDSSVAEVAVFDGEVYVGTWDFTDSYKFYRVDTEPGAGFGDTIDLTPTDPALEGLSNLGVMKLIEDKNGYLYLGTVNYADGFTLLRTRDPGSPTRWEVMTTNGFGNPDNAYAWAMIEAGTLLLGTFNSGLTGGVLGPSVPLDGRAQLWYLDDQGDLAHDNDEWVQILDDGFGARFVYGIRNMEVFDGYLALGTASNFFIPDPNSALYEGVLAGLDDLLGALDEDPELRLAINQYLSGFGFEGGLQELLLGHGGPTNFIGTQIWATRITAPPTLAMLALGLTAGTLLRRRRRTGSAGS
jgi:hypothetical protein